MVNKCRAWYNGKFIYNPVIDFERQRFETGECEVKEICGTEIRVIVYGDIKNVMQYIGLKDKHGNEIYEGDVLKHHTWYLFLEDFDDLLEFYHSTKECYCCVYDDILDNYEIIGNTLENPELLNQRE